MRSIGVRELKENTSRVLRLVRDEGEEVEVTHHGRVVARIVPARRPRLSEDEIASVCTDLDRLAAEIGARWPAEVTATEAVSEGRREL